MRLQNTSGFTWSSTAPVPITLGYHLARDDDEAVAGARRTHFSTLVPPGGEVLAEVEVMWPAEPGRYRLSLDLVMEGLTWFEARVGEPIAAVDVEVVAAAGHDR